MHRASIGRAFLVSCLLISTLAPMTARPASAQSETRERQAAAEAYDQGTASYLSGDYPKAAEWFETANRLSPAAPALIQATRAHQQAGHLTRAATLALRLTTEYASEPAAVQFGKGVLAELAPRFVRVEVDCTGCTLDVDGTLQESQSFFVDPGVPHSITASFETGERKQDIEGAAGSTQHLSFEAPPPPPEPEAAEGGGGQAKDAEASSKPFGPAVTFVAGGVTAVLLAGAILSGIDTNAGVQGYEDAANARNNCVKEMPLTPEACMGLYDIAKAKFDKGQAKETRTTVLWIATGAAAAATAVFGLLLTDWSGSDDDKASEPPLQVSISASASGGGVLMKGHL